MQAVWNGSQMPRAFLESLGLKWDDRVESTVCLYDGDALVATGSRQGNLLKCIGVTPERQGEGLAAALVSELTREAAMAGHAHLLLYTKPSNAKLFGGLGFYPVGESRQAVLMENRRGRVDDFVRSIRRDAEGPAGAIVANANPFTRGHLYLAEHAASRCGLVYLFILSEEQKGAFSARDRLGMAKAATAHLRNVAVVPTGPYLVSSATFPEYFLKSQADAENVHCALDLSIFAKRFAAPLGIRVRFVGDEPSSVVTRAYNEQMKRILPGYGIDVVELPRIEVDNQPISASRVRELFGRGQMDAIRPLVPESTFIRLHGGEKIEVW